VDKPFDPSYRRKMLSRRIMKGSIAAFILIFSIISGFSALRPSVKRSQILIAKVEKGDVQETATASGVVIPEYEQVMASPITTTVRKVLRQPGDILAPGDSLLALDIDARLLERERLDEQIRLKRKQKEKTAVDLDIELNDLESQYKSRAIRLDATAEQHAQNKKLYDLGGNSRSQFKESEMEVEIARIEVERISRSIENARKRSANSLESLDLEIGILENQRREIENALRLARTRVEGKGVLTWIVQEEGSTVTQGQVIARIADLSSFAVKATISEFHAARLSPGLPAILLLTDGTRLTGKVSSVLPIVENGIMTFLVAIDEKINTHLRSNLRAEVNIVTAEKRGVLRIKKGQFAEGSGLNEVFVIRGDRAVKKEVTLGLSGFEWYEVTEGLAEGDEVIISDMKDKIYADELRIR
jgi:HlyD family secretion protein